MRGAISYARGKITILDRRALERCACECYEAVTLAQTQSSRPNGYAGVLSEALTEPA